jgi:hypothetical protein
MGTFEIKSQTNNAQYEYVNDVIIVQGNYQKNALNGDIQSINGTAYRKDQEGEMGEHIGSFNGYVRNGEIRYSLSEMSRRDSNLVWDAIDEIEPHVTGENNNSNE